MSKLEKKRRRDAKKRAVREARPAVWEACREKFLLTEEDIKKAKIIGLVPEKLILNPEKPAEPWKKPVRQWIRAKYRSWVKKQARRAKPSGR